jgi:hypothetical protein
MTNETFNEPERFLIQHWAASRQLELAMARIRASYTSVPGGHLKFLHLWPGQNPPANEATTGACGLLPGMHVVCKLVDGV